jgi:diguanylate cyclase (GGDEF)-like protein/PAS domain S-box-containing protein
MLKIYHVRSTAIILLWGAIMIHEFFTNTAIIIAYVSLIAQIAIKFNSKITKPKVMQALIGVAAGILGIILMIFSFNINETVRIDLRHITIALSAVYGGPIAAIISGFIVGVFRIVLFGINRASIIASVGALVIGVFCGYLSSFKMPLLRKHIFANAFGLCFTSAMIFILINDLMILRNLYLRYWTVSILGGILSYYVCEYMISSIKNYRELKYYETMANNMTDLISTHEPDATFSYVSPSIIGLLGYRQDEIVGKRPFEFIHEEDLINIHEFHNTSSKNPLNLVILRYRTYKKCGDLIWMETTARAIRDSTGELKEILAVSRDITERVKLEEEIIESKEKISNILESITDAFFALDKDWKFTYLNKTAEKVLGKYKENVLGKVIWDMFPRIIGTRLYHEYHRAVKERVSIEVQEYYPFLDAWYETRAYPNKDGISVYIHDITDRIKLEEELKFKQEQLSRVIETTPSGILLMNTNGEIEFANAMAEEILNLQKDEITDRTYNDNKWNVYTLDGEIFPNDRHPFAQVMTNKHAVRNVEFILETPKGELDILSSNATPLFDGKGNISKVLVTISDITESKKAAQELKRISNIDGLTGIANRRYFDEALNREWQRCARNSKPLSLIMLDIDHFKFYNDTYGHLAGDECLKAVAKALSSSIKRGSDVVARYGGEEFAIILTETDLEGAKIVGERIRAKVEAMAIPHIASKVHSVVTCSVGVAAVMPNPLSKPDTLISKSDNALYESKRSGRNRVSF